MLSKESRELILLTHSLIRMSIIHCGYIEAMRQISTTICSIYQIDRRKLSMKKRDIVSALEDIIRQDTNGQVVASCISIAATAHVLLYMMGVSSKIVIGVRLIDKKILSHSWVEITSDEIINFQFDNIEYKPIRKFDLDSFLLEVGE